MIVANKVESIQKANEIASKLLVMISDECKNFKCEDDPAENIYLTCHIVGNLFAKTCISIEEYGKIYGINALTKDKIADWLELIANETMRVET